MLSRVRDYARNHARRKIVLCDAHGFGAKHGDKLLFDFHSFPIRAKEIKGQPLKGKLSFGHGRISGRSAGGVSPSGWKTKSLPYIVEFDNWGYSGRGGEEVGGYLSGDTMIRLGLPRWIETIEKSFLSMQ